MTLLLLAALGGCGKNTTTDTAGTTDGHNLDSGDTDKPQSSYIVYSWFVNDPFTNQDDELETCLVNSSSNDPVPTGTPIPVAVGETIDAKVGLTDVTDSLGNPKHVDKTGRPWSSLEVTGIGTSETQTFDVWFNLGVHFVGDPEQCYWDFYWADYEQDGAPVMGDWVDTHDLDGHEIEVIMDQLINWTDSTFDGMILSSDYIEAFGTSLDAVVADEDVRVLESLIDLDVETNRASASTMIYKKDSWFIDYHCEGDQIWE